MHAMGVLDLQLYVYAVTLPIPTLTHDVATYKYVYTYRAII